MHSISVTVPFLSVVMPVFNGEKYIKESIESILNQTFENLELIIIDDGSSDNSLQEINKFKDSRIRLFRNGINRGVAFTRNRGLCEAKGKYLAWCDCDDISLPRRFEEQIEFLEKNPGIGACGTWLSRFDKNSSYVIKSYIDSEILKATLLFRPSMLNATVMLRLSEVKKNGLCYNNDLPIAEDYDFILKCSKCFNMTNIPKVLYKYRASDTSIMKKYENQEQKSLEIHKVVYQYGLQELKINASEEELVLHRLISSEKLFQSFGTYKACYEWLCTLYTRNTEVGLYEKQKFKRVLADQFLFITKKASKFGLATLKFYLTQSFNHFGYVNSYLTFKLALRCIIKYNRF